MAALLFIANGIIMAALISVFCQAIFGDGPGARLLRVLLACAGGFGYFLLCITVNESPSTSNTLGYLVLFGPLALAAVGALIGYMYK